MLRRFVLFTTFAALALTNTGCCGIFRNFAYRLRYCCDNHGSFASTAPVSYAPQYEAGALDGHAPVYGGGATPGCTNCMHHGAAVPGAVAAAPQSGPYNYAAAPPTAPYNYTSAPQPSPYNYAAAPAVPPAYATQPNVIAGTPNSQPNHFNQPQPMSPPGYLSNNTGRR
jgi:hypothetical protein